MIAQTTIDQVFEEMDVVDVISNFLELKKSGSNYSAKSPFTEEKTPSFMVSPAKQIFKCFSTGQGGNALSFLTSSQGMTFPEAIEYLANKYNIEILYEGKDVTPEKRNAIDRMKNAAVAIQKAFSKELWSNLDQLEVVKNEIEKRQISKDAVIQWGLGYAPDEWRFLCEKMIPAGYYQEGEKLGLLKKKESRTYDVMRNRLIFPIHNHRGEIIAFGGRDLSGKDSPKYLNSTDSEIYIKSKVLYGLHFAQKSIRQNDLAYIVEGYWDVIGCHESGLENTVGTCGTAFTDDHAKLLKRYTTNVVVMYDGDKAGRKALERSVFVLIKHGFNVDCVLLEENQDPDDLAREFRTVETINEPTLA